MLELARHQIIAARQYTESLLADLSDDQWYVVPDGCPSHIAWQVGHLAMAEYALVLLRVRGKLPEDGQFIDNDFLRQFKKGSQPLEVSNRRYEPAELRAVLQRVHQRCLEEMVNYREEILAEPLPEPYFVFPNKLGSLLFCAAHEMLHAGQIGLIRRLLGKPPLR